MNLRYNMASNGLCTLVESGKIEYHKIMYYQDILLQQRKKQQEQMDKAQQQLDNRIWV